MQMEGFSFPRETGRRSALIYIKKNINWVGSNYMSWLPDTRTERKQLLGSNWCTASRLILVGRDWQLHLCDVLNYHEGDLQMSFCCCWKPEIFFCSSPAKYSEKKQWQVCRMLVQPYQFFRQCWEFKYDVFQTTEIDMFVANYLLSST